MSTVLEEIFHKTGLIGTILLGGPDPSQGRNITVFEYAGFFTVTLTIHSLAFSVRYHRGKPADGKHLNLAYDGYLKNVQEAFLDFVSTCYREFSCCCDNFLLISCY